MKSFSSLFGLALVASVSFLLFSPAQAQGPIAQADLQEDALFAASAAAIDFGSGKVVRQRKQQRRFQQLLLQPRQVIDVSLQFSPAQAGAEFVVEALDGGRVIALGSSLTVGADGTLAFKFQAPEVPGDCRIAVHQTGRSDLLQFWVIDKEHPDNNPPELTEG